MVKILVCGFEVRKLEAPRAQARGAAGAGAHEPGLQGQAGLGGQQGEDDAGAAEDNGAQQPPQERRGARKTRGPRRDRGTLSSCFTKVVNLVPSCSL